MIKMKNPDKVKKKGKAEGTAEEQHAGMIKLAIFAISLLLALTFIIYLLVPSGSAFEKCMGVVLSGYRYSCLESLAQSTGNYSICSHVPAPMANNCYSSIAEQEKNLTICDMASSSSARASCTIYIANSTDTYQECATLSGADMNECDMELAIRLENTGICSGITDAVNRTACVSAISFEKAVVGGNASYCAAVENKTNLNETGLFFTYLNAYGNKSYAYTNITDPISSIILSQYVNASPRDECYLDLAMKFHNQTYCSLTSNQTLGQICAYYSAAGPSATSPATNSSHSFNFSEDYMQLYQQCVSNATLSQYCPSASQFQSQYALYHAILDKNTSICASFNQSLGDYCYFSIAVEYNQSSYCGYIQNGTMNAACVETVLNQTSSATSQG